MTQHWHPWRPAGSVVKAGELHIWRYPLISDESQLKRALASLSDKEKARATRLRFIEKRREFVLARAFLRNVLAVELACDSQSIDFASNDHGKPRLSGRHSDAGLYFNLAHSHDWAVLVVSRDTAVGIDVEMERAETDYLALARRFFSNKEQQAILGLPDGLRKTAFFRCWTRKEAFVKAQGVGISYGLANFSVSAGVQATNSLIHCAKSDQIWSCHDLSMPDQYFAAVVSGDAEPVLQCWDYSAPAD